MSAEKQIKQGAVISYIALAINISVTLFYTPWMVSKIGTSHYGLYTLSISLINLFIVDFGLSTSIARFVARYRAENNQKKLQDFIGAISTLYIGIDVLIFIILFVVFFFVGTIYKGLTAAELEIFRILYIIVGISNLISFPASTLSGLLNGFEQFVPLKICDLLNKIGTVILVVLALSMGGNVISIVMVSAFVAIAVICIKFFFVRKRTKIRFSFTVCDKSIYKEVLLFSIWSMLIMIAQRILYNATPSVLAISTSSQEVAIFSPAFSIQGYYYSIAAAINGLFLPAISRYLHEKQENKISTLMVMIGRYQIFVMGLVLVGFFCIGREFMILWMGRDFEASYYCALCMLIPQLFECSQQIGYTSITAKGYVKYQAILMMSTSVIGLPLSFFLARSFGAIGSSIAILIIGLTNVIGIDWILINRIRLDVTGFFKKCYLAMGVPYLGAALLGKVISDSIKMNGVRGIVFKGLAVTVVYITVMWCFALKSEEKETVRSVIIRIRKKIKK